MRRHPLTLALHEAIDMMLVQNIMASRAVEQKTLNVTSDVAENRIEVEIPQQRLILLPEHE